MIIYQREKEGKIIQAAVKDHPRHKIEFLIYEKSGFNKPRSELIRYQLYLTAEGNFSSMYVGFLGCRSFRLTPLMDYQSRHIGFVTRNW